MDDGRNKAFWQGEADRLRVAVQRLQMLIFAMACVIGWLGGSLLR
jgi:hypothetical protein